MNRLKELRELRGWNMKEVARKVNIPYTTYVGYEKGARDLNSETMILFSDLYGVSIDYLVCNERDSTPLDDELAKQLQMLRDREDLRSLLDVSYKRQPEQVQKMVELFSTIPEG